MVLTDVAGMAAAGIALGSALWLVLAWCLESQLYGVRRGSTRRRRIGGGLGAGSSAVILPPNDLP